MNAATYLHFLIHALRLRWDPRHRVPLTTNIQLTYRCNYRCRYCEYDHGKQEALTLEVLRHVFREARQMGGRRVNLSGGEPLLRDDLAEIVSAAKRLGFFVSLSTNGSLAAKQIDALEQCDRIMLSYDGPPDVRAFLSGDAHAEDADMAIEVFRSHRIPFWTTTVLTRQSIARIDWIVEQARKNGSLANFVLLHTQPEGGLRFHPSLDRVQDIFPTDEQTRAAVRQLIALKKSGAAIGSSLPYLEEFLRWPDYRNIRSAAPSLRYRCLAGRAGCELAADGMLYSCGWLRDCLAGVSVVEHGFAEAFDRLERMHDCNSCAASCWLESNLILGLNVRTVLNWVRNLEA